jgi:membrane-bound inhibitor of C-type lysozyme
VLKSSPLLIAGLMLLPLAACSDPADRPENTESPLVRPPMMNMRPASFDCEKSGRVIVRPVGDDATAIVLAFASREIQLKSVPAKDGQKYSDGSTVFWMNDSNANLLVAGRKDAEACQKPGS